MKWLDVAVAVIRKRDSVLVSQRPLHATHGGMWEFPGGKIEPGESVEEALRRELEEEINIQVQSMRPLLEVQHDYGSWGVTLWVGDVLTFSGTPVAREQQLQLMWLPCQALPHYPFPKANQAIIQYLCNKTYSPSAADLIPE
ncbi:MAG: NUDIX domain-containing protein [Legionellaceae bacterium]|nr:NUDIX domain-containing protein [Legionellaceae bacterium]